MEMEAKKESIERERQDLQEYIDGFLKDIEKCETPEGRDAMRRAQVYVNTVGNMVQSAYDRTAYINALGAIMTRGSFDCTVELKKINPKLFQGRK